MPVDPSLAYLRCANERLYALLAQLRQESVGAGIGGTDALLRLLSEVANTARLSGMFAQCVGSAAGEKELSKYREILEELRQLLPTIQIRLLSDRARLEAERAHCCSLTAWAETSRRTL